MEDISVEVNEINVMSVERSAKGPLLAIANSRWKNHVLMSREYGRY